MRTVSGGTWIADVHDQGIFPVRRPRGNRGCRVVRGRGPRPERFGRCRSGRRCGQAAHRPQGRWPVGRVPHDHAVSPGRTGVLSSTASPRAAGRTCAGTSWRRSTGWPMSIWRSTGLASLLEARLNADIADGEAAALPCDCGGISRRRGRRSKVCVTAPGPVTLERAWYHCEACGSGFGPV